MINHAENSCFTPANISCLFKQEDIEQSISSRFERQVQLYPHQLAVKTYQHQFTYQQLDRSANRLARSILAQKCEGDAPIPILVEHGAAILVAMLGVLKAGKSWVPIDPDYPSERIEYILNTCQANAIVTNHRHLPLVKQLLSTDCSIVNLDKIDPILSDDNLNLNISPDATACILPTSGSTGEPKWVVNNHRNLLHSCLRWTNTRHMRVEDRVLLVSSHCHVGGINNIFSALLNGATVYPFNLKEIELANLADWIVDEKITIYHSVPTIFRHFINSLTDRHSFPNLRLIHIGGESVFKRDYDLYQKYFTADCVLVNGIGCTEISGYRYCSLDRSSQITTNIIPVGYAAEDTEVLICDDRGIPVENNAIGEIVVKSAYLALGYWQRPDLDARVFMPDPTDSKQRLYRTGDLGQMSSDGCLMHLGRKDAQIKIRGYRVELGECEAVLSEHPSVKEVAVIARYSQAEMAQADRNIEQSSIAYIVPNSAENISERSLFEFLQNKLPSYLIPAVFIFTDVLPLNANNKIDRLALPSPKLKAKIITQAYIPARNEIEAQLVAIWTKVLDLERVSIYDNFFALGGHSLSAVSLFAEIGKTWGQTLPLSTLFEHQTIAELAAIIDRSSTAGDRSWPSLITIEQRPSSQPPLFCIHDVSGDLLFYRNLIEHLAVDRSCYGLQPRGLDGKQAPTATIPAMATDYLNQILKVQPVGPYYLVGFSFGGLIAFEIARQLHALGHETALLAILDTIAPVVSVDPMTDRVLPQTGLQVKFNWVNKFMRFDRSERFDYLRNGIRRHTLSKLRIPHRLYLRYIKRSLPALGRLDVYWANYRAMELYVVRSTYPGKVVLFCSGEKLPALETTPQLNWERVATGGVEVHVIPKTNHLTMIQEPHVRVLATQLTHCLASSCDAQSDSHRDLDLAHEASNYWHPDLHQLGIERVQTVRLSFPDSL